MPEIWEEIQEFVDIQLKSPLPAFILIDGPAGSGKSTLAGQIADRFTANLLHMDDFYFGWQEPLDVDLYNRLHQAVSHLENPATTPDFQVFNWGENSFQVRTQKSIGKLIVIEGVGAFGYDPQGRKNLRIWTSADSQICFNRVLDRDGLDFSELIRQWQIHEQKYFERTNAAAKAELFWQT